MLLKYAYMYAYYKDMYTHNMRLNLNVIYIV